MEAIHALLKVGIIVGLSALLLAAMIAKLKDKSRSSSQLVARPVLTDIEQIVYHRLKTAVSGKYEVLSQVAFSQFLKTEGENKSENFRKFATARQKVADFLICDRNFQVLCAVEVDDSTHGLEKDARRDAMLKEAGIKTLRIKASKLPDIDTLKKLIKQYIEINN